jgi:hypothetical protein
MRARPTRRIASAAALVGLASVGLALAPAAEASAYRYWTYWQAPTGATAWAFATQGPATTVPADGSVEGWSFGISTQSGSLDDAPTPTPDFDAICAGTPVPADGKRVALVIDPGPPGIGPAGQAPPASIAACVTAAADATGYDILRSVAEVRIEGGLVCALGGYPTGECAPVLDDAEAQALLADADAPAADAGPTAAAPDATETDTSTGSGSPVATIVVAAALLLAAALGYRRVRALR